VNARPVLVCMKTLILEELAKAAFSRGFRLSDENAWALDQMYQCRTPLKGGKVMVCPHCHTIKVLYTPCNHRGCPTCYEKNQIQWKIRLQNKLLNTSHYHLTFSMPQAYVITWLKHKQTITDILFETASTAIKSIEEKQGLLMGSVLVFQSHGKGMSYKPHIHCILTAGGLNDKSEWEELGTIPYTEVQEIFKREAKKALNNRIPKLSLPDKNKIYEQEWRVHPEMHSGTGKWIAEYLSHSISGVVIDMKQQFTINEEEGTIGFNEIHGGIETQTTLSKKTFAERYLNHIPPSRMVTVRYYSLYSNRHINDFESIKEILPKDTTSLEVINEEELCPVCKTKMLLMQTLKPLEVLDLKEYGFGDRAPPAHGEVFKIA